MTDKTTRSADCERPGSRRVADYGQVTLSKLAIASAMYDSLTVFNRSLGRLDAATGGSIDLTNPAHRLSLLKWLNEWGCRNLPKTQHSDITSPSILEWYQAYGSSLVDEAKPVWALEDGELKQAGQAYSALRNRPGARRVRRGRTQEVHIGPTAASKILYAIRPDALMPWDAAMRASLGHDGSPRSYLEYLLDIRGLTVHIETLCRSQGFGMEDLPSVLGRPDATVLSLVNEYLWVTVTRRVELPSSETLVQWSALG